MKDVIIIENIINGKTIVGFNRFISRNDFKHSLYSIELKYILLKYRQYALVTMKEPESVFLS